MQTMLFLMGFLFSFIVSCGGGEKLNTSIDKVLSNLIGVYTTKYKDTDYEVWIEKLDQSPGGSGQFISVFMFEKSKTTKIQSFLAKYQDVESYSADICEYIKENPDKFTEYSFKESPSFYYDISADQVWRWDNNLGALSYFILSSDSKDSSFDTVSTLHPINLPTDDEHVLKSLDTDSQGKATKIHLLETGFIKKIWNYVLSGPSLSLTKESSQAKALLKQYLDLREETNKLFTEAGKENRSYCDKN